MGRFSPDFPAAYLKEAARVFPEPEFELTGSSRSVRLESKHHDWAGMLAIYPGKNLENFAAEVAGMREQFDEYVATRE